MIFNVLDAVLANSYFGGNWAVQSRPVGGNTRRSYILTGEYVKTFVTVTVHDDGRIVDAHVVQYAREDGQWVPNSNYPLEPTLTDVLCEIMSMSGIRV